MRTSSSINRSVYRYMDRAIEKSVPDKDNYLGGTTKFTFRPLVG